MVNNTYHFGTFRLDTATQLLWQDEINIKLALKVYRLLLYFLQHAGRLISHEEIFNTVWEGRIVDDSALRQTINALRKTLEDTSKSPRYIATVCKQGYRFIPNVTVEEHFHLSEVTEISALTYRAHDQILHGSLEHSQELLALQTAFKQASTGARRLLFLHGEQGVGKTTLLNTFLAHIDAPELTVLRARCVLMSGETEFFLPLLEALERRCCEPHGKALIDQLKQTAPSWLYQIKNILPSDEVDMLKQNELSIYSNRMLREGANFFEMLSVSSACILMLDNAHWSDEFTLNLLNFLAFRCSPAKLLIIISYRENEGGSSTQRIEAMRTELSRRGLCDEIIMQRRSFSPNNLYR